MDHEKQAHLDVRLRFTKLGTKFESERRNLPIDNMDRVFAILKNELFSQRIIK